MVRKKKGKKRKVCRSPHSLLAVLAQYMPKEENPNLEEEYRKFKGSTRRGSRQQQDLRRPSATLLHLEKELSSLRREASSPPDQDVEHDKPPLLLRVRYGLWYQLQFFKKYEFKFALKTAVAVFVLCVWAFIPSTAAWFNREKGQWASITVSFCILDNILTTKTHFGLGYCYYESNKVGRENAKRNKHQLTRIQVAAQFMPVHGESSAQSLVRLWVGLRWRRAAVVHMCLRYLPSCSVTE